MRIRICLLGTLVAAGLLVTSPGAGAAPASCGFPKTSWTARAPQRLGLDAPKLQDALDFATQRRSESVLVIRHGCLAGASRLDPITSQLQLDGWSMTKAVTAMVVGRAVTLGKFGIDKPIGPLYPEADKAHKALTPRQLLTMSSGLRLTWARDFNGTELMPDRIRDALSLPFDHKPGTYWSYNQSPVSLVLNAVQRSVRTDIQDWTQKHLFGPIGITRDQWTWDRDRAGNTQGWAHLKMVTPAWARLGYLMLHNGNWNGRQLIARSYLKQAFASSKPNHAYGFFFWLNGKDSFVMPSVNGYDAGKGWIVPKAPRDSIIMAGQDEQRIYIVPSLDMVVLRLGQKGSNDPDFRVNFWTSRAGELDNGLMRRVQLSVTDKPIKDPGEYEYADPNPPSAGPGSYLNSLTDPVGVLAGIGVGPQAPAGCTAAGCS
jgi:CubicO group peptidase (beta-lactamase class C family)